jgi:NitT/TauT family transport system substrate-binding protein
MRLRTTLVKATTLALAAALFATSAVPVLAAEKIPFTLSWKLMGPHSPVFLAVDRGYFAAEGLDPDIVAGDGSANVVNRITSGAFLFGIGDVASLIKFNTLNPTKRVKALYNQTPADLTIVTLKRAGITKPEDLKGRIMGSPVGDTAYKMFPAYSAATGVKASDIKWEHMAPNIREAMLMQGKVDAITANEGTAYFALKGAGVKDADIVYLRYADVGINIVNIGLMTNESLIKEKPELVKKMVRAINRGVVDAIADPKAAVDALMKRDPLLDRDIEMGRWAYSISQMVKQPDAKAGGLGFYSDKSVATSIDTVAAAESLPSKIAISDVIDMSFLPPAAERGIPAPKTN